MFLVCCDVLASGYLQTKATFLSTFGYIDPHGDHFLQSMPITVVYDSYLETSPKFLRALIEETLERYHGYVEPRCYKFNEIWKKQF